MATIKIKADRWPWQKGYNWHGMVNSTAPLNQPKPGAKAAPRFGGGWQWALGFEASASDLGGTVLLNLLFGMIRISWRTAKGQAADRLYEDQKAKALQEIEDRRKRRETDQAAARERDAERAAKEHARRASLTPEQRAEEDEFPF